MLKLQLMAERIGLACGNCCAVGTHAPDWPPPINKYPVNG
jgi:hypothetical protein